MLNTSDVKSLSKGGTTVSLEEISNSIDNKLSIDNLTGSNGIDIAKNAAGDKVNIKGAIPITVQFTQLTETIGQYTVTLRPNVDMPSGPYAEWKFVCDNSNSYYDFIGFHLNGASEATSKLLYAEGPLGNVKTLFSQSIYGSGNIDLYRHNLYIHFECKSGSDTRQIQMYVQLISSSNTNIDSLTDLFSMFSNIKDIPASGTVTGGLGQNGVCVSVTEFSMSGKIITMLVDGGGVQYDISNATLQSIRDTVTTV